MLAYDPIGEGERNIERKSGTRAHDVAQSPPELGQRVGGLMMTDVMQAVSYLASRPAVLYALHASRGPALAYNGLEDTTVSITTHGPDFFADMHRRVRAISGA